MDDDFELCLKIQEYFEDEFVCNHAQTTETASQNLKINKQNLIILAIEIGKIMVEIIIMKCENIIRVR